MKDFLIIGELNVVTYKEIFPLIKENKVWLGVKNVNTDMVFKVPSYYEAKTTRYWQDENGQKWRSLGNACWLTNLDHKKRHEEMTLYKKYNAENYPKYDNHDAIEVGKVTDIPCDYDGIMGVPITFLGKYNPSQFEIIKSRKGDDEKDLSVNGKCPYFRILIRKLPNKKYNSEKYPKYDNYDAIEVGKVTDIPCDYDGIMGVPLTFLGKHCPEQFEIIGIANSARWIGDFPCYTIINGKKIYNRILIKKRR